MNLLKKISECFGTESSKNNNESSRRILIAEDVTENRIILQSILEKAGFELTICTNGKEAVSLAQREDFDLILMDVYMPEMNGIEATKQIKSDSKNKSTPIIAVTAADSEEEKAQRIAARMDDYVAKPIKPENLIRRVDRQLKISRQVSIAESGGDIVSLMAQDPMYKKAIKLFVKTLPQKIKEIKEAFDNSDMAELARKVHSLKGTGGMAGFSVYTVKAIELEREIKSENPDLEKIRTQIDELSSMAARTKKKCKSK